MSVLRCSVVIPTRNRAALLEKCLQSLSRQTLGREEMEIIVVDDGSTDGTAERVRAVAEAIPFELQVLKGGGRGPAAARNVGWCAAKAPIILFTDDDCEPARTRCVELVSFLERQTHFAGVGGKTCRIKDSLVARYVDDERCFDHPGDPEAVQYLVTANAAYRRDWLEKVGGFKESFPCAGGEDPEISFRMRAQGAKLAKIDGGLVRHNHPRSVLELYRMNWRYGRGAYNLTAEGFDYSGTGRWRDVFSWFKVSLKDYLHREKMGMANRVVFSVCRAVCLLGWWRGYHYQAKKSAG